MHRTKIGVSLRWQAQQFKQRYAQSGLESLSAAFSTPQMQQVIAQEAGCKRHRIYPPMVTLRLFIDQVLSSDGACQNAVSRRLSQRIADGQGICSLNSGPYCKARARLTLGLPQRLCKQLGRQVEELAQPWRWWGRQVKLFDATTVSMPDTQSNQKLWPQSRSQKPGLGFPVVRIGALMGLAGGALIDYAAGPLRGKQSGEQALLRQVAGSLQAGDILLADALHSSWCAVQMLQQRGVDLVMPNDGKRKVDFDKGRRLGERDHVVWWPKPPADKRPDWMDKQQHADLPDGVWVREVQVGDQVFVTTLMKADAGEIAALYKRRWNIEVDFRALKAAMDMDVLRCKSPSMVLKEIAVYLLSYNLVRWVMAKAAQLAQLPARQLSFTSARRLIWQFAEDLRRQRYRDAAYRMSVMLQVIAKCVLPQRPERVEPRAKKRRPKPLPLLRVPRHLAREQIIAKRALKVVP